MMRFRRLVGPPLFVGLIVAISPTALVADIIGPFPPPLGAYYWMGSHNGNHRGSIVGNNDPITITGNGSASDWANNWHGRYQVEADNSCQHNCQPGLFIGLPPQDGDYFFFTSTLVPESGPHNISGGGIALPASGIAFSIHGTIDGGSYDVATIAISTDAASDGTPLPMSFNGTTLGAGDFISVFAFDAPSTSPGPRSIARWSQCEEVNRCPMAARRRSA
jgi:hypothetical protein